MRKLVVTEFVTLDGIMEAPEQYLDDRRGTRLAQLPGDHR
jgi:hypothetical protein